MKILVVDDHALIRAGLRPLLEGLSEGEPAHVFEAGSYSEAVAIADAHPDLDLVLLDFNLPAVNGFSALVDIQARHADVPVVVMSGNDDPAIVRRAMELGALGFIPKSSPTPVMINALRLVLAGGVYLPREIMGSATSAMPRRVALARSPADSLGLTARQREVLSLILAGKPNKIICRELGLAEGTVKNHVAAVLKALNATNRVEAVIAAGKLGIK